VDTREEKRDGHLRSPDFFDAQKYPTLEYESTKIEPAGEGRFRVTGALTIHGQRRDVVLDVEDLGRAKDPWGNQRIALAAKGTINRKDFGLNWNQALETGGVLVGERVDLEIEVQAVRKG
jgi:polyisoprenoid-binding protein YceI